MNGALPEKELALAAAAGDGGWPLEPPTDPDSEG